MAKAQLEGGYWMLSIVSAGEPPCYAVKKAVPGITPADYYWVHGEDGVTIAFRRLADATTFVKAGGPMMVAIGLGGPGV